jgi:hypothetical protein
MRFAPPFRFCPFHSQLAFELTVFAREGQGREAFSSGLGMLFEKKQTAGPRRGHAFEVVQLHAVRQKMFETMAVE